MIGTFNQQVEQIIQVREGQDCSYLELEQGKEIE
jgi:hypothetical protein